MYTVFDGELVLQPHIVPIREQGMAWLYGTIIAID